MPYLNNIIEQDHRFIKKITRPMKGFKAFHSASATVEGIEDSGFSREQVDALTEFMDGSVATKADIERLDGKITAEITELSGEIKEVRGELKADIAGLNEW